MIFTRNLRTMELLAEIDEYNDGNIEHFKDWAVEELIQYILVNYPCSRYCAKEAALWLSCGITPEEAIEIEYLTEKLYKQ